MLGNLNVLRTNMARVASTTDATRISGSSVGRFIAELHSAAEQWLNKNQASDGRREVRYNVGGGNSTNQYLLRRGSVPFQRKLVTSSTRQELEAIHSSLATLPGGVTAYQTTGMCEFQAKKIVEEVQKRGAADRREKNGEMEELPVSETHDGLWRRIVAAITAEPAMQAVAVENADQLLNIYLTHGPFVLRGPKLDDPRQESDYLDHAIAVMAAVKVRTDTQGEKIVFCALDCNDRGKDQETLAAQEQAAKLGKAQHALTPEEADSSGADRRRIRLIDGDSSVRRLWNYTMHLKLHDCDIEPVAQYMVKGEPILTEEQTGRLKEFVVNHWSEVEDYSGDDYSHLAHRNFY